MLTRPMRPPPFNRMETAMTKSKTVVAAFALAATFTAIGGQAQAHPHFGHLAGASAPASLPAA